MGCLESCFKQNEEGEPDERSSLLRNENSTIANTQPITALTVEQVNTPVGSISKSRHDEQSLLNGILTKYSSDVVDVSAIDSRIDAVEYMNRVTLYNRKLAGLGGRMEVRKNSRRSVTNDPAELLGRPAAPYDDILMILEVSENAGTAMNDVRVIKKQDLTIDLAQR